MCTTAQTTQSFQTPANKSVNNSSHLDEDVDEQQDTEQGQHYEEELGELSKAVEGLRSTLEVLKEQLRLANRTYAKYPHHYAT
jgi:hypothetical protein